MKTRNIRLIDKARAVVAEAKVADEGDYYGGVIDLSLTPPGARALFDEFEEIVNGQMLSFLDEIQEKLAGLGIKAVFDDGTEASIHDLQVYPGVGEVSFRLADQNSRSAVR
jgi:hypothetical protein